MPGSGSLGYLRFSGFLARVFVLVKALAATDRGRRARRDHYQAGLDIAARLADADPTNTGWQRDLSISRERLEEVASAAGDLPGARDHYQAGLDIRARLADADPTNTGWQRDLSIVRQKISGLNEEAAGT